MLDNPTSCSLEELRKFVEELYRLILDLAADLDRLDRRVRPDGDGGSDLRSAPLTRRAARRRAGIS